MNKIDAVYNMQLFIERNFDKQITLADLAKVSYYSPWYSYRLFIEYVKMSPSDYLRRFRLSSSALRLRDCAKEKIIDIAYEFGYNSVDGYQRAFQKEFGVNPYEYSKHPTPICLFIPYKVIKRKENEQMSDLKVMNVFISVEERPERKVIIKRGLKATEYFDYCNEVGCDIWGILTSIKSMFNEPACLWLPKKYVKPNTSTYVQGVEVPLDYNGTVPEGFEIITLPKATYLRFQGEPFKEEDYEDAITSVWDSMKKYNPASIGYTWDEENPRIQFEPVGTRGYIEMKAIKKIEK